MWITSVAWECPGGYGGLGTVVSRLLPALSARGKTVHICTEGPRRKSYKYSNALVVPWQETLMDPGNAVGVTEMSVLTEPCVKLALGSDVLVSHDFHSTLCALVVAMHGVRVVHVYHIQVYSAVDAALAGSATKLVANSRKVADAIEQAVGRRPEVVYFPSPYSVVPRRSPFKRRTRILIFLRYQDFKDPTWAFKTLNDLYNRGARFTVKVAGKGTEVLRSRVSYPWLEVVGTVDEKTKVKLMMESDLLLYPARMEPYGLVPLESIALGTPALISSGCGVSEVLPAGVFDLENPGDLEEHLRSLLGSPEELKRLLEEQRSSPVFSKRWIDVVDELLG
ncbi:MAG: glycosyltransferase family 4 protein [Desulfurococcaceae archaeon]